VTFYSWSAFVFFAGSNSRRRYCMYPNKQMAKKEMEAFTGGCDLKRKGGVNGVVRGRVVAYALCVFLSQRTTHRPPAS
jgi:hypothetical protein